MSRVATIAIEVESAEGARGRTGDRSLESRWRVVVERYDCEGYRPETALSNWINDQLGERALDDQAADLADGRYRLLLPGEPPAYARLPYYGQRLRSAA